MKSLIISFMLVTSCSLHAQMKPLVINKPSSTVFVHRNAHMNSLDKLANMPGIEGAWVVNLQGNDIEVITSQSFKNKKFKNIRWLNLSYNKIKHIEPGSFKELTNLRVLFLGHNQLESFEPGTFKGLKGLKIVTLNGNPNEELLREQAQKELPRALVTTRRVTKKFIQYSLAAAGVAAAVATGVAIKKTWSSEEEATWSEKELSEASGKASVALHRAVEAFVKLKKAGTNEKKMYKEMQNVREHVMEVEKKYNDYGQDELIKPFYDAALETLEEAAVFFNERSQKWRVDVEARKVLSRTKPVSFKEEPSVYEVEVERITRKTKEEGHTLARPISTDSTAAIAQRKVRALGQAQKQAFQDAQRATKAFVKLKAARTDETRVEKMHDVEWYVSQVEKKYNDYGQHESLKPVYAAALAQLKEAADFFNEHSQKWQFDVKAREVKEKQM